MVQRNLATLVGDDLAGKEAGEDLEGVLQAVEAPRGGRKVDAELVVFGLEPGRTDGQLEAPVGSVVDGDSLGGQNRRMTVGDAGDEEAEADPGGGAGQGGQGGHPLEAVPGAVAVHGDEVIEAPGAVKTEFLDEAGPVDDIVEVEPLLGDIYPETHGRTLASTGR